MNLKQGVVKKSYFVYMGLKNQLKYDGAEKNELKNKVIIKDGLE